MPKGKYNMPNEGGGGGGKRGGEKTATGRTTGLRRSNEVRSDTTKKPTSRNPYPNGLS